MSRKNKTSFEGIESILSQEELDEIISTKSGNRVLCNFYFIELNKKKVLTNLTNNEEVYYNTSNQKYICKCKMLSQDGKLYCFRHIGKQSENISNNRRISLSDYETIETSKTSKPIVNNKVQLIISEELKEKARSILKKLAEIPDSSEEETEEDLSDEELFKNIDIKTETTEELSEDFAEDSLDCDEGILLIPDQPEKTVFIDPTSLKIYELDDNNEGICLGVLYLSKNGCVLYKGKQYNIKK